MKERQPKNQTGFNLLELIVVLAITAILSAISIPSFVNYLQANRLVGSAQTLYFALQQARSEAIKRNTNVYVSFVPGGSWCYGINPSAVCSCNVGNSCSLGSTSAPSNGQISMTASGLNNNAIIFEPDHGAANAVSTITFTNSQNVSMSVKVSTLGNLTICSSQVAGYQACT